MSNQNSFSQSFDILSFLFFSIVTITVVFFLLNNINSDFEFRTTLFFTISFVVLFVIFVMISSVRTYRQYFISKGRLFFMERIELRELIWIPIGLIGVLGVSFIAVQLSSPISAVFASGLILLYTLYKTQHFLIPVLIHGIYNDIVILIRQGSSATFLSQTGISIPEVGISIGNLSKLTSEMIFQIFLVASTEELMKIAIIAFVLLSVRQKISSGNFKWFAGVVAVAIWTVFHLIQAM